MILTKPIFFAELLFVFFINRQVSKAIKNLDSLYL